MAKATVRAWDHDGAADVGTLWTMRRDEHTARWQIIPARPLAGVPVR